MSDGPCSVPGCTGTVDGGYCDTCGLAAPRGAMAAALRAAAPAPTPAPPPPAAPAPPAPADAGGSAAPPAPLWPSSLTVPSGPVGTPGTPPAAPPPAAAPAPPALPSVDPFGLPSAPAPSVDQFGLPATPGPSFDARGGQPTPAPSFDARGGQGAPAPEPFGPRSTPSGQGVDQFGLPAALSAAPTPPAAPAPPSSPGAHFARSGSSIPAARPAPPLGTPAHFASPPPPPPQAGAPAPPAAPPQPPGGYAPPVMPPLPGVTPPPTPAGGRQATSPTYRLGDSPSAEGLPCSFPGCGGRIDAGYCDTCGLAPNAGAVAAAGARPVITTSRQVRMPLLRPTSVQTRTGTAASLARGSLRTDSVEVASRRTGGTRLGLGLVDVPAVPTGDPALATMAMAEVPEDKRFCSMCNNPVGRSRDQRPGRTEGFCPSCRTHFSFTPKLLAGDMVAGQYEVLGVLAHGGLGWVYLARDRAVSDRWVVLKGLLDAASDAAAVAAVAERRFLAALDHPNVVQIYNFVTHENAGYIVMEYVGGKSLKTILKERRDANEGRIDPLPVDQAIAYALASLPAMGYLHAQGLVYCDMKPDNVLLFGDSLKIIDLGGVRRIDDDEAAIYGTMGYQAPEVAELGPTVASDLYTVGRLLAVLVLDFRGYQTSYVDRLPPPDEQPLLAEHESLHRFLLKATATDPTDRFDSAEEMTEQLMGILREQAAKKGAAQPAVSRVFGPDGVVGAGVHDEIGADWRLLPEPKMDPADPGVGFLLGLADGEPAAVVTTLTAALAAKSVPSSAETLLRLARAELEAGDLDAAATTLDRLGAAGHWRVWWQRGLRSLADGNAVDAVGWLDPVYTDLPGEVPAKLALALAHELAGDLPRSADLYDVVSRTDPSYVSGAFGLARVRAALGDREGAVDALGRVPAASSVHVAARIAAVRALASTTGGAQAGHPSPAQLERASLILGQLHLEPRRHATLARELFEAGLSAVELGVVTAGTENRQVLGRPLVENALREGLESTYRQLARHAATTWERNDLIDRANRSRPRTLL